MQTPSRILLLNLALTLTVWAVADLPKKAPITKYTGLWTNSPFTSKPPPPEAGPVVNPLEDYALVGVSPVGAGYRVTMMNKKKPEERITVDSDRPREGFQILEVTRKKGDPLGTVVQMKSGESTGTISFDEKLLTLVAAPVAKAPPKAPPGVIPGQTPTPQPGVQPQRQPRPRVVPPPQPGQPAGQPAQPATSVNQSSQAIPRPIHRGGR